MTSQPSIGLTAAVCTRGRPAQLARALASLRAQSVPMDAIVVVESGDATAAVQAAADAVGAIYVNEPAPGAGRARDRALRTAKSPIVAFIDDDVVSDAGWAAALIARFEDDRVGICTGRVEALVTETAGQRLFEANGGFSRGHEPLRLPADAHRPLHGMRAPLIAWAVSIGAGCSMAVRRELALELGSFDVTFGPGTEIRGAEEHDLIWRVLQAGRDVVYEPTALAWHDHRPDLESAHRQIVGHQRALIAFLWKTMRRTTGRARLPVAAFLAWRLAKPGARVIRRLAGRDPLPVSLLLKMWRESWRGLSAPRARPAAVPRLRTRTSEHEEWNPASSS